MKKRLSFKQLLFEQQVLGILLFSILVVFLWIISSIYFSYSSSTLTPEDTLTVEPLNPQISDKPLLDISGRKWWSDQELAQFAPSIQTDINAQTNTPTQFISTSSANRPVSP